LNVFDRIDVGFNRGVDALRKRWAWFDHFWRALDRFLDVNGGRLAAAISYYGFFAAFSLTVVAYSILGRLIGQQAGFVGTVNSYLSNQLAWVTQTATQVGSERLTVIGTTTLVLTGVGWIDSLRSSARAVWGLHQHPGHWIVRWFIDLGMLVVLGILLGLSLAMTWVVDRVINNLISPHTGAFGAFLLRASGPVLQLIVNLILSAALLTLVPRLRLSLGRLVPTAVAIALGIQLLNTLGRAYIDRLDKRPAYQLVSTAVGLLVYLYLLNQLFLFGCALAATATQGSMVDHSGAAPRDGASKPR
jgi:membrane protein